MNKLIYILAIFPLLLQTACVGLAKRPKGLPQNAMLAGGVKGGSWLKCDNEGKLARCEIYNYAGRFFEAGLFEPTAQIPDCYPSFIITDYRFDKKALIPLKVRRNNGGGYIIKRDSNETIQETIAKAYLTTQKVSINSLDVKIDDKCQNGHYFAQSEEGGELSAHIWAGDFAEILIVKPH